MIGLIASVLRLQGKQGINRLLPTAGGLMHSSAWANVLIKAAVAVVSGRGGRRWCRRVGNAVLVGKVLLAAGLGAVAGCGVSADDGADCARPFWPIKRNLAQPSMAATLSGSIWSTSS
ncbi:MAG: hypothetical protein R2867_19685 [Caldilineaceae bacterium]